MKIFLIMDETRFYQPNFVADFLRSTSDEVVGAALVTKVSPKSNLELYLIKHWYFLRFSEMVKLMLKKMYYACQDALQTARRDSLFYSVKSVYKHFKINYFEVEYSINKPIYLDKIKALKPDVIVSSNSLFFGPEILALPTYGCINRHSALLPAYGGLWPVFQAFRSGEPEIGVSVHIMKDKIDDGAVLSQEAFTIQKSDTIDSLYQKCFKMSGRLVIQAIEKIRQSNLHAVVNKFAPSYFSFPTADHWREFRTRGGKFI